MKLKEKPYSLEAVKRGEVYHINSFEKKHLASIEMERLFFAGIENHFIIRDKSGRMLKEIKR